MKRLVVLMLLLVLSACGAKPTPAASGSATIGDVRDVDGERGQVVAGDVAPDFSFTLNGATRRLSDLRGQPVIVNFWATWCGPCVIEMPDLNTIAADGTAQVIGINLKEERAPIESFAAEHGLTFPLVVDPEGLIAARYGITNLPVSLFIDREGRVVTRQLGGMTESLIRERLATIP